MLSQLSYRCSREPNVIVIQKFKCVNCGSKNFYRHKKDYRLTFFEGHVHCIICKREVDYADDDWLEERIGKQNQLNLF